MITIYKHTRDNTIALYFYSAILKQFGYREIVIEVEGESIKFRAPTLLDNNVRKIPRSNIVSFPIEDCDKYLGKYNVEQEGDWFYLEKTE